jgi:hypothetical protein
VLEQADYPDLFAALGSTWDSFAHPVDGTPTVGASQFALPNFKGLYLAGAGDAGGDDRTLGVFQDDETAVNGLSTGNNSTMTFRLRQGLASGGSTFTAVLTSSGPDGAYSGFFDGQVTPTNTHTHPVISSDNETRPKTAPITYIIKLYSDTTSAVSVGINEATATEAGVVRVNRSQTKILASDVNSDGPFLTFNNLVIGRRYKIGGQIRFRVNIGGVNEAAQCNVVHNGNTEQLLLFRIGNNSNGQDQATMALSAEFKATSNTVSLDGVSLTNSSVIRGNGTKDQTFVRLTELNNTVETTDLG